MILFSNKRHADQTPTIADFLNFVICFSVFQKVLFRKSCLVLVEYHQKFELLSSVFPIRANLFDRIRDLSDLVENEIAFHHSAENCI